MYVCEKCGRVSEPRVGMNKIVVETRPKTYPFRKEANRKIKELDIKPHDRGGSGSEIVKEIKVCRTCK